MPVQPEGTGHHRLQGGFCHRITGGEQCHVMTQSDQFLGQPGHNPLGAAIQGGRHAFHQGGDLRDSHDGNPG